MLAAARILSGRSDPGDGFLPRGAGSGGGSGSGSGSGVVTESWLKGRPTGEYGPSEELVNVPRITFKLKYFG